MLRVGKVELKVIQLRGCSVIQFAVGIQARASSGLQAQRLRPIRQDIQTPSGNRQPPSKNDHIISLNLFRPNLMKKVPFLKVSCIFKWFYALMCF